MRFLHVAGRTFNTPLLPAPRPCLPILESLGGHIRRRGVEGAADPPRRDATKLPGEM